MKALAYAECIDYDHKKHKLNVIDKNGPNSIGKLQHLESIDFSGNRLAELSRNMKGLTSLRSLKLSFNSITPSLQEVSTNPDLRQLYIIGCELKQLPSAITNMTMLETIDIGANELTSLFYNIAQLTNLHSLYMGGNRFISIPRELVLLKNLTTLYMDGNSLNDISAVGSFKQIRVLYLSRKQITSVPSDIGKLNKTLESLNLDGNKLTSLPNELLHMTQLKTLYI